MQRHGLTNQDMKGITPSANPLTILTTLRKRNQGKLTFAEAGNVLKWRASNNLLGSYMGYALKKR